MTDIKKSTKERMLKKHYKNIKKNEESDSDSEYDSELESEEMNVHEYRKFLSKIFPSKHLDKKISNGEKIKDLIKSAKSSKSKKKK